jgi:hypothetical protein
MAPLPTNLPDPEKWPSPIVLASPHGEIVPLPVSEQPAILTLLSYVTTEYARCSATTQESDAPGAADTGAAVRVH